MSDEQTPERTPSLHFDSDTVAGVRLLLRTSAAYNDPPHVGLWWNDIRILLPALERKFPHFKADDSDPLLPAMVAVEVECFSELSFHDRREAVLGMRCDEFVERLREIVADDSQPDNIPWTEPKSPKQWAQIFGLRTSRQFLDKIKRGELRHVKLHTKSYKLDERQLPKTDE